MALKMAASLPAHWVVAWLIATLAVAGCGGSRSASLLVADPPLHPHREPDHWGSYLQWTSISQSTKSGVDLWTRTDKGCACPWNVKNKSCACCSPGGCHCGERVPKRCGQCGIEHQCDTMCNVTLDAGQLMATSRQPHGHIKSLELHDSQECWYRFQPQRGSRVQLQIYRLIDTGYLNQNRCDDGHLEWQLGPSKRNAEASQTWRLCGPNQSYSPPVLLFSDGDQTPATLVLKAGKGTRRGKLLAHFVFTPTGHDQLGVRTIGGQPVRGADCHWLFQDTDCVDRHNDSCSMASPGHPGLYPPNRRCHYRVVLHSPLRRLRLHFQSIHLPADRCDTDNIRIFVNGDLHSTLCSHQPFELLTHGPDVTVEFNSGPFIPPYLFNGFWAKLHFQHVLLDDSAANSSDGAYRSVTRQPHAVCDYWVRSAALPSASWPETPAASGFFSSVQTPWKVWPAPCSFAFVAQRGQSVQLSLFSHNLTGADCSSQLEVHPGALDVRWDTSPPLHKICAPSARNARNSQFKFNPPLAVHTFNASLSIRFRMDPQTGADQFFEGAFVFHNESYGRLVPGSLCHTVVEGRTGPSAAHFGHHWDSAVFWNVMGPVRCNATFLPHNGQTVSLTVDEFSSTSGGDQCLTQCDADGCHCQTVDQTPLEAVDHAVVWLSSYDGSVDEARPVLCLCGDVQALLPLTLVSNTKLQVDHYVADYRYGKLTSSPRLQLAYLFSKAQQSCGPAQLGAPSGSVSSHKMGPLPALGSPLSTYFYADCLWIATAQAAQQWTGSISTTFDGKCSEWNVTFHPYNEKRPGLLGHVIDVLCPDRDNNRFIMPHGVNVMAIRLRAWHSSPVEYRLEWRTSAWPGPNSASAPDVQGAKSLSSVISVTSAPSDSSSAGNRHNFSVVAASSASTGAAAAAGCVLVACGFHLLQ